MKLRREKETVRIERLAENIATIRAVGMEDWDLYQTVINNQLTLNPDIVYIAIFNVEGELKAHALKKEWIDLGYRTEITQWEEANIVWRPPTAFGVLSFPRLLIAAAAISISLLPAKSMSSSTSFSLSIRSAS